MKLIDALDLHEASLHVPPRRRRASKRSRALFRHFTFEMDDGTRYRLTRQDLLEALAATEIYGRAVLADEIDEDP